MTLKLNGSSSGSVSIDAPASTTDGADITFKLPVADGTANQILKTDASGNLGWLTTQGQNIKAWCNFKGDGTEAINRSYNIASFTDHAAGDYTFTFTNAMDTTNYVVLIHTSRAGDSTTDPLSWGAVHTKATGSFGMNIVQTNSGFSSTAALSNLAEEVNFMVIE